MGYRTFLIAFALNSVLAVAALSGAAHKIEPAEPDLWARDLHLLSGATQERNGSHAPAKGDAYSLGLDPANSSNARSQIVFQRGLGSRCGLYAYSYCDGYRYIAAPYSGEDFPLQDEDSVVGNLHFAWHFTSPLHVGLYPHYYAEVSVRLTVADQDYGSAAFWVSGPSGEVNEPLFFQRSAPQEPYPEEGHDHEVYAQAENGSTGKNETPPKKEPPAPEPVPVESYAHDVVLHLQVFAYDGGLASSPLGSTLVITLDTAGGTFVTVHEQPPPPPPPEPVVEESNATFGDDVYIIEVSEEPESDGRTEIRLAPGPELPLFLLGVAALGLILRRRLKG